MIRVGVYILLHDPSVCVFMYGQATESRWVNIIMLNEVMIFFKVPLIK